MKYFISYQFAYGNKGGYGNVELETRKPMNNTSSLKEIKEFLENNLRKKDVHNANVVILNFIELTEDNPEEESSINREY